MSQQPQYWRNNDTHLAGVAAMCGRIGHGEAATAGAPVTVYLHDSIKSKNPLRYGPAADNTAVLALRQLHINLAIASWGALDDAIVGQGSLLSPEIAKHRVDTDLNGVEIIPPVPAAASADPVIRSLSDALTAMKPAYDRHSGIQADALRLAMVVRLLALQSEAPRPETSELAGEHSAERQIRALQKWRLKRVVEYIDHHLCSKITLVDLAAVAGLSRMHFASQFRVATGLRPHEYLLRRRIHRAEELLARSTMTIVEIALTVGFQTQAHFTTVFKRFVGHTPYQWRHAHYAAR